MKCEESYPQGSYEECQLDLGHRGDHEYLGGDAGTEPALPVVPQARGSRRMAGDGMSTPIVRRRKRPVEVDTIQWTGSNLDDLIDFTGGDFLLVTPGEGAFAPDITAKVYDNLHDTWVGVKTGQHVVRGVKGELYPIDEDVLADTYEPVEETTAVAETAAPTDTNRRARLLNEMAYDGGRWKSGDVVAWYGTQGLTSLGTHTARRDLAALRDSGAITQHDEKGVRFYTLTTQKGGTAR